MASWTYFTSYLDGTRTIRAEERDELWDNFEAVMTACDADYTLDATILAELKASGLLTDLTPLKISGTGAGTVDLSKTIAAAPMFTPSGEFQLEAAATAEGLSGGEYDDLLDPTTRARLSSIDDYRIWNILKRCIDTLSCTAPLPELMVRTASASKTKCGWEEFGTPSTPPKIYLVKTLSGTLTSTSYLGTLTCEAASCYDGTINVFSGACSFNRADCSETDTTNVAVSHACTATFLGDYPGNCEIGFTTGYTVTVTSSTVKTWTGDGCSGSDPGFGHEGTATETLSSEYTTAHVIADAIAAATSFTSWGSGTVGSTVIASYDLSTDELTASVQQGEYKFELPDLAGVTCYHLEWDEVFYPEGGGAPTVTPKSYDWNGTDTETTAEAIGFPGAQGTVKIENLAATFDCP